MIQRSFTAIVFLVILAGTSLAAPTTHVEFPMDYDEVRVLDAGKEVQVKKFVRNSEEESAFLHDVDLKVCKQLGVADMREIIGKKMWQTYTAEVAKRIDVKRLPTVNPDVFKVVDENNKVIRRIDLGEKTQLIKASSLPAEISGDINPKSEDLERLNRLVGKWGDSNAELRTLDLLYSNKPKTFFLLLRTRLYHREGRLSGYKTFSKAVLVDSTGKELWVKYFPADISVLSIGNTDAPKISDGGEIVAIVTSDSDEGPGGEILHLFDITGKEVFLYPGEGAVGETPRPHDYNISANGRYLSYTLWLLNASPLEPKPGMEVEKEALMEITNNRSRTVFWDVQNKKSYETSRYLVNKISADGIADVQSYGADKMIGRKQLDLKQYLK